MPTVYSKEISPPPEIISSSSSSSNNNDSNSKQHKIWKHTNSGENPIDSLPCVRHVACRKVLDSFPMMVSHTVRPKCLCRMKSIVVSPEFVCFQILKDFLKMQHWLATVLDGALMAILRRISGMYDTCTADSAINIEEKKRDPVSLFWRQAAAHLTIQRRSTQ